jgi:nucleotide-binding universal stress UspA family protein
VDPGTELHAVCGYDRSDDARRAIELAADLLAPFRLTVATGWRPAAALGAVFGTSVLARLLPAYDELDGIAAGVAAEAAEEGAGIARARGLAADTVTFESSDVALDLARTADEQEADVVVVGGRERAARHPHLLGSVASEVLQAVRRPVLVGRGAGSASPPEGPHLLAYDGSPAARAAIAAAGRLLRAHDALVAHVWLPPSHVLLWNPFIPGPGPLAEPAEVLDESSARAAERLAEEGADLAREAGLTAQPLAVPVRRGTWRTLVDLAGERGSRCIVVGANGRSLTDRLLGTVAEGVARHAARPALVVPAPHGADDPA